MNSLKAAAGAGSLLLALGAVSAHAEPGVQAVHVDLMGTCHQGLLAWLPQPRTHAKCGSVGTPQVKIFDASGRLRYIGSALDAIQWAKSGQPGTPIPGNVVVRDAASEARITRVAAPPSGHDWVTYYGSPGCEPCIRHLGIFRADVMPKLAAGTRLTVFEVGE